MLKRTIYLLALMTAMLLIAFPTFADNRSLRAGAVFAMTNAADGNEVAVYQRDSDGTLELIQMAATGGLGRIIREDNFDPRDALGAQAPMVASNNRRFLFVVNAGSDQISSFRVRRNGLELVDIVDSNGDFPASLTFNRGQLYVLNSGGEGNITGFEVSNSGRLTAIPNSTRDLNVGGDSPPFFLVSPAQVSFDPRGDNLIVTIKGSNEIRVFPLDDNDLPSINPVINISAGNTPFGFTFDRRGRLMVTEAFGSAPVGSGNASAVSTYEMNADGSLDLISTSVDNFQTAACWVVIGNRGGGNFAYVTNNLSNNVSAYRINRDGSIDLNDADGIAADLGDAGSGPNDLGLSRNGRFLYITAAGTGDIVVFEVDRRNGSLTQIQKIGGLPVDDGAVGLVSF